MKQLHQRDIHWIIGLAHHIARPLQNVTLIMTHPKNLTGFQSPCLIHPYAQGILCLPLRWLATAYSSRNHILHHCSFQITDVQHGQSILISWS